MTRIFHVSGIRRPLFGRPNPVLQPIANQLSRRYEYRTHWLEENSARWYNFRSPERLRKNAERIVRATHDHCVILSHSYGGLASSESGNYGRKYLLHVIFNGSMDPEYHFNPHSFKSVKVVSNPRDRAVMLGGLLPMHSAGSLGRVGYKGRSPFVDTIFVNTGTWWGLNHQPPVEQSEIWADRIHGWIREALAE